MSAPREIIDLIDRYTRNADSYRSSHYGETEVRVEFINPFFKCLGWDVDNTQGFAEAYKDVINEDAIKIGLSFLNNLVNLFKVEGEVKKGTVEESKSARRYTVGGLHMAVLDELGRQKMIEQVIPASVATTNASYVVIQAVLHPVNYYA